MDPEYSISDTVLGCSTWYTWELHLDLFPATHPPNPATLPPFPETMVTCCCVYHWTLRGQGSTSLATSSMTQRTIECFSRSSLVGSASRALPLTQLFSLFVVCFYCGSYGDDQMLKWKKCSTQCGTGSGVQPRGFNSADLSQNNRFIRSLRFSNDLL